MWPQMRMALTMYLSLALLFLSHAHSDGIDAMMKDDWFEISNWINSNGGYVNPDFKADIIFHNGIGIRGVVSTKAVGHGRLVFRVPRKLWFSVDKFADINRAELARIPNCSAPLLQESHFNIVKMGGALARERRMGNASFFHVYISKLPTLDDFRSFHPRFMNDDVREDFAGLPLTDMAAELQLFDSRLRNCFLSWTKEENSPVAGISLEEFDIAQTQYRTRAFGTGSGQDAPPALIPGADLLNTEKQVSFNTNWDIRNDNFLMDTFLGGTESGVELFDEYCPTCDNEKMMLIWGLYLQDNENPLKTVANCNAKVNSHHLHKHGKFKSLREASEAILDLKGVDTAQQKGWKSPGCRKELLSVGQGPLRCSFARLAFEQCKQEWGYLGSLVPEYALAQRSTDIAEMIDMISRSYIHAVHPALLSTSRTSHSFHKNLRKGQQNQNALY